MLEKHIAIKKTARYFILGQPSEKIENLWFVCHGYGQLANYFLKDFESINDGKTLIVAPEGLHRFYWNGFDGKVVASWMTKEDRLNDIKDYVNFLDAVYFEILENFKERKLKINILGFSQGVATVCRWITLGKARPENLILWAGMFPADLKFEADENIFGRFKTTIVVGNKDEFLKEGQLEEYEKNIKSLGVNYELIRFDGKHELNPEVLRRIRKEQ